MRISIPSILLGLGVKCLLNWALVFLQRNHICQTFIGVFSISLALVDTFLPLSLTTLYLYDEGCLFGVRLTRHHVCLLVQILGQIYGALQWPVVIATGLDHYRTASRRLQPMTTWVRKITCLFVTGLLWTVALLYVFLVSGFSPVLEDEPPYKLQQCWVFHTSQILQVAMVLLLTVGCAMLYLHTGVPTFNHNGPRSFSREHPALMAHSDTHSRKDMVHQALWTFLSTWTFFLVFLVVCLLLPVGIPAHLGLNIPWLCFLNSVWIGVVLCTSCPASQPLQGMASRFTDSFCDWRSSSVTQVTTSVV